MVSDARHHVWNSSGGIWRVFFFGLWQNVRRGNNPLFQLLAEMKVPPCPTHAFGLPCDCGWLKSVVLSFDSSTRHYRCTYVYTCWRARCASMAVICGSAESRSIITTPIFFAPLRVPKNGFVNLQFIFQTLLTKKKHFAGCAVSFVSVWNATATRLRCERPILFSPCTTILSHFCTHRRLYLTGSCFCACTWWPWERWLQNNPEVQTSPAATPCPEVHPSPILEPVKVTSLLRMLRMASANSRHIQVAWTTILKLSKTFVQQSFFRWKTTSIEDIFFDSLRWTSMNQNERNAQQDSPWERGPCALYHWRCRTLAPGPGWTWAHAPCPPCALPEEVKIRRQPDLSPRNLRNKLGVRIPAISIAIQGGLPKSMVLVEAGPNFLLHKNETKRSLWFLQNMPPWTPIVYGTGPISP